MMRAAVECCTHPTATTCLNGRFPRCDRLLSYHVRACAGASLNTKEGLMTAVLKKFPNDDPMFPVPFCYALAREQHAPQEFAEDAARMLQLYPSCR
jgi:hypothetical protein